jgi:DNA repair exonuclease SbcCD nuclease subunit
LLRAADGDASDADQLASVSLQNVLRGLGEQLDGSYNRMLAMHAMVDGSVTSTGQPLIGAEMHVSLAELGLVHASIGVLGHIHKAQHWTYDGADYVYTGSPYRTNYGEIEEKSVLLVEFDEDHNATWQRIPTPASKMLHVTANWIEDEDYETGVVGGWVLGFAPFPVPDTCDAYVRLRCVVAADQRAAAQAACAAWKAECLQDGALDVKVEIEVRPVNSARAPEVARAVTLADKLSAFWSARSTAPEAERAERLIGKAHILESETSHAV